MLSHKLVLKKSGITLKYIVSTTLFFILISKTDVKLKNK